VLSANSNSPQDRGIRVSISALSDRCAQPSGYFSGTVQWIVSISALSDRCAQLIILIILIIGIIVSISALSDRCAQHPLFGGAVDVTQFQYPLFRIVVLSGERAAVFGNVDGVSISALSDRCAQPRCS